MSKARDLADIASDDVIATTASGVNVTGAVTAGDMFITGPTPILTLTDDEEADEYTRIQNASGNTLVDTRNGASDGQFIVRGQGGGVTTEHFRANANGVGIFNTSPTVPLDVTGSAKISGNLTVDTSTLHVDSPNNRVGIGTTSPSAALDVVGDAEINGVLEVSSVQPRMDFVETDVAIADTTRFVQEASIFRIQTANNGAYVAEDYAIEKNATGATAQRWRIQNSERMRIDSTGLGIGTTSPSSKLHVHSGVYDTIAIFESSDRYGTLNLKDSTSTASTGGVTFGVDGDALYIQTGATRTNAMRIDESGNVLVGQTGIADYTTTVGTSLRASGFSTHTSAGAPLLLNRLTTDGDIAVFRKDNTTVGSIGALASAPFFVSTIRGIRVTNANVLPCTSAGFTSDNTMDLGSITGRYDDVFATNGTIQTSDRNEKEAIASLTPTEMLVAARLSCCFKNFKWKDAVAEKGLDAARMHSGIIAQDVQDAFAAEGLDASDYAMFISGTWWETQTDVPAVDAVEAVEATYDEDGNELTPAVEAVEAKDAYTHTDTYHTLEEAPEGATERTRLGVRYPELLAFVAAYNDQRFLAIEARLAALEGTV